MYLLLPKENVTATTKMKGITSIGSTALDRSAKKKEKLRKNKRATTLMKSNNDQNTVEAWHEAAMIAPMTNKIGKNWINIQASKKR